LALKSSSDYPAPKGIGHHLLWDALLALHFHELQLDDCFKAKRVALFWQPRSSRKLPVIVRLPGRLRTLQGPVIKTGTDSFLFPYAYLGGLGNFHIPGFGLYR